MMREGGVPLKDVFDQVRLRVSDATNGGIVPWDANRVDANFMFFERSPNAPEPPPNVGVSTLRDRPLRELGANEAYQAALARDTISAYQDFLAAYPNDRDAKRVRAILAARREALIWRRTLESGTVEAYWSYLRRYPTGPHAIECRLWLARLDVVAEPPPDFQPIGYDVPPPPPDELVIVDQPVLTFADPDLDLPPLPPVVVLAPPPEYIIDLPPPPPPVDEYVLPTPAYAPAARLGGHTRLCRSPACQRHFLHYPQYSHREPEHRGREGPDRQARGAARQRPGRRGAPARRHPSASQCPGPRRAAAAQGDSGRPNPLPALAALHVALPPSVAVRAQQANPAARDAATNARPAGNGAGAVLPALTGHALPGQPTAQPLPGQLAPLGAGQHGQPSSGPLPQAPPSPSGAAGPAQPNRTSQRPAEACRPRPRRRADRQSGYAARPGPAATRTAGRTTRAGAAGRAAARAPAPTAAGDAGRTAAGDAGRAAACAPVPAAARDAGRAAARAADPAAAGDAGRAAARDAAPAAGSAAASGGGARRVRETWPAPLQVGCRRRCRRRTGVSASAEGPPPFIKELVLLAQSARGVSPPSPASSARSPQAPACLPLRSRC